MVFVAVDAAQDEIANVDAVDSLTVLLRRDSSEQFAAVDIFYVK